MNLPDEIEAYAHEDDKPILRWLYDRYGPYGAKWRTVAWFMANSLETPETRAWRPTKVGLAAYYAQPLHNALHNLVVTGGPIERGPDVAAASIDSATWAAARSLLDEINKTYTRHR